MFRRRLEHPDRVKNVTLTHQRVDAFLCHVVGKQLHQILPQVPVQLGLDVELALKPFTGGEICVRGGGTKVRGSNRFA